MSERPKMCVDRCVCFHVDFKTLLRAAERHENDRFARLQRGFGVGTACGMCRPYIKRMLRTGQTTFHELVLDEPSSTE